MHAEADARIAKARAGPLAGIPLGIKRARRLDRLRSRRPVQVT